jgi:hypothetical protein
VQNAPGPIENGVLEILGRFNGDLAKLTAAIEGRPPCACLFQYALLRSFPMADSTSTMTRDERHALAEHLSDHADGIVNVAVPKGELD